MKILTRVDNLSCLCSGADDFTIMVWDLQLFRYICVLEGHSGPISDVIELRNGNLCSASTDHSLIVWATIPGIARAAGADKLHKSSSFAVSDGSSGSKRETSSVKLRMSAAQQLLQRASAVQGELYRLERTLVTRGHKGPVRCVVELADGRLCSCGDDKVLKFWDPVRLVCDLTMEGHWAAVNCVLQLRSGLLCSCSDDRTIKLWHLHRYTKKNISTPDDHCVRTLTGHSGVVRRVRELRDGSLCSCSGDNKIILWTPRQPSESP